MPLQQIQRNEVLGRIQAHGLNPADFEWYDPGGTNTEDGLSFRPIGGDFRFVFYQQQWRYYLRPGLGVPDESGNAGTWYYEIQAVNRWLQACKAEVDAPDMWEALQRERDALSRPTTPGAGDDEPFTSAEIEEIAGQMAALKEYVREAFELNGEQLREVDAKLDYLVDAARRAPSRIDWWNQMVGALVTLTITATVHPGVVQGLLSMAAHALGHLFGAGPPQLLA
jgi:hypothetical protein